MVCFTPNQGYESVFLTKKNRKFSFTMNPEYARRVDGCRVSRITPCHKCEGCRWDYSREWAVRIMHEHDMHVVNGVSNSSFITLTYDDDHIPLYGSIRYEADFKPFFKKMRSKIYDYYGKTIRFFMVCEYGDKNLRPHYHAIIFGFNFPDKYEYLDRLGNTIYRSPFLESCWTERYSDVSMGYSSVGNVTHASAAYVARYNMKKLIGTQYDGVEYYVNDEGEVLERPTVSERYIRYDRVSGDRIVVEPEKNEMSRGGRTGKGGIGKAWFDKYAMSDIYSAIDDGNGLIYKDEFHLDNGIVVRPPKYYDKCLEVINLKMLDDIKLQRQDSMSAHADDFTPERLRQRKEVLLAKIKTKSRNIGDVYK